jgi:hypothetical protein
LAVVFGDFRQHKNPPRLRAASTRMFWCIRQTYGAQVAGLSRILENRCVEALKPMNSGLFGNVDRERISLSMDWRSDRGHGRGIAMRSNPEPRTRHARRDDGGGQGSYSTPAFRQRRRDEEGAVAS